MSCHIMLYYHILSYIYLSARISISHPGPLPHGSHAACARGAPQHGELTKKATRAERTHEDLSGSSGDRYLERRIGFRRTRRK